MRGKRFIQSEVSCQNESVSSQPAELLLAPLQSLSTEVCKVFTSLLQFCRKSSNIRTKILDWAKTRRDVKVSLIKSIPQTEGRGKKSLEEGKYAVSIIGNIEFYQARKCLEARSEQLGKKARQGKQIKRGWSVGWWRGKHILYEKHLH